MSDWLNINGFGKNQSPKSNSASGEAQKPGDSRPISFAPSDEILAAFAEAEASKQSTPFTQTVQRVQHAIEKVNSTESTFPNGKILYHSKNLQQNSNYSGPIAILLPEVHINNEPDTKVKELDGSPTRAAIKTINVKMLEQIFLDPELNKKINIGFNESFIDLTHFGSSPEEVLKDKSRDAADALAYLLTASGKKIFPAEHEVIATVTSLILEVIRCLRTNTTMIDLSLLKRNIENNNNNNVSSYLASLQESLELLEVKCPLVKFHVNQQKPNQLSISFNPQRKNELLQQVARAWLDVNNAREKAIAIRFSQESGIIPMIIGSSHLTQDEQRKSNLISHLENLGIPVIVMGAEAYSQQIK